MQKPEMKTEMKRPSNPIAALLLTVLAPSAAMALDHTDPYYDPCAECARMHVDPDSIEVRPDSIIIDVYREFPPVFDRSLVFRNMREIKSPVQALRPFVFTMNAMEHTPQSDRYAGILYSEEIDPAELEEGDDVLILDVPDSIKSPHVTADPDLLRSAAGLSARTKAVIESFAITDDILYLYMMRHPERIQYTYRQLPPPPSLPEDDRSFAHYLRELVLPGVNAGEAVIPDVEPRRIYWLHTVNSALQFSQAFISPNWYQGGNNHLALLFNFGWDVNLNTVYKPDLMFNSALSYKLAINSNTGDALHKYSIAQDLFQYNLKMGVKAFRKWFYSFTMQFKTQFFNAYPTDSDVRTASFLSPADLNVGLGMTYNTEGRNGTLKFSVSIAPISYNLKTCISDAVDHLQFNIPQNARTRSEYGSNAELNLLWDITPNIQWKSRLFLFSDYHYFQADWENTFNFSINRFLSTQLYVHPRFDSSAASASSGGWHHWMLKEILSFGLSYTFSTKP